MGRILKVLISSIIILAAVGIALVKYWDYVVNPWTRDGQVRAQVIQITPRVTGPIVTLPITDNQFVKAGDLLFAIDPRTFAASLEQGRADLDKARDDAEAQAKQVEAAQATVAVSQAAVKVAEIMIQAAQSEVVKNRAELARQKDMLPSGATSRRFVEKAQAAYEVSVDRKVGTEARLLEAKASLAQSEATLAEARAALGAPGDANASVRAAKAAVRQAELNLEFTQVRAPVDGYITNLNLRLGSQAVANQPALALVDVNSFWIHGYFRENRIAGIQVGDRAIVTLMTYHDTPLEGRVESVGWGIAQDDGSAAEDLLPSISPTFEWIRLAQRVPVRVHLLQVPDAVKLRVGTTASVLVMSGRESKKRAVAVPRLLQ